MPHTNTSTGEAPAMDAGVPVLSTGIPVVGVGASAGGLAAYEQLLRHTPPDTGLAFVLVQHLDPGRESLMAELLQRYTRMPVAQAEDDMLVEANHVYTIPPDSELALLDGHLKVLPPSASRGSRLPIDAFFRSLAQDRKERAIGVVLSGAGSDGTDGLRSIKAAGGLVIVQDPDSASYSGMPLSAIRAGVVDYVLPPADIPARLSAFIRRASSTPVNITGTPVDITGTPVDITGTPVNTTGSRAPSEAGDLLRTLCVVLREQTGHDFSGYKESTVHRRVERRMALAQLDALAEYVRYVQSDPREAQALFHELLIRVTGYFRDPEAFGVLERTVIPKLLPEVGTAGELAGEERRLGNEPLRVWVPGCSTGEEAYSIAVLLRERLDALRQYVPVQVFATDIDAEAIATARVARYPKGIAADVGEARLRRYFTETEDGYRVNRNVREMMVFSVQNLAQDPPFSHLDLLSCRNVLIYMKPELQRHVCHLFHYALRPDGFLFLGNSESLTDLGVAFQPVDRTWRVYRRMPGPVRSRAARFSAVRLPLAVDADGPPATPAPSARASLESYLLAAHTPPSVVVDEDGELVYVHGHTGKYLEPAAGEVTTSVTRMARGGIRLPLAMALRRVQQTGSEVVVDRAMVETEIGEQAVKLTVRPVSEPEALKGLIIIIFEDLAERALPVTADGDGSTPARVAELEDALAATRQYLHATVDQLEAANQELAATNEELQSANEELQSANEELQTAKEELQSVNEELLTVNTELEAKLEELSQANADMHNLFSAIDVGAVLLDLDLCIRRFTPVAKRVASLIDADVGRPIGHTVSHLRGVDLVEVAQTVLSTLSVQEREVAHADGGWFWMRARPYRTMDYAVRGVTLTFHDITPLKTTQQELEAARDRLEQAVRERTAELSRARARLALAVAGSGGGLWYLEFGQADRDVLPDAMYISPELKAIIGFGDDELPNTMAAWKARILPEDRAEIEAQAAAFLAGERDSYDLVYRIRHRDGSVRWLHSRGEIEYGPAGRHHRYAGRHHRYAGRHHRYAGGDHRYDGRPVAWAGIDWDVTEDKAREDALRQSEARFHELFRYSATGVAVYETVDGGETFLIRDINRAGEMYSQVQRDAVLGRSVEEVFPGVADLGLLEVFRRVWRTGEPEHLPMRRYIDDRMEEWVENYVYALPSGEIVAVYEDATERIRALTALEASEARLAAILRAVTDGIVQVDAQGRAARVNAPAADLLGYAPEELEGRAIAVWLHPDQAEGVAERLRGSATDRVETLEATLRHKDGSDVLCTLTVMPLTDADPASVVILSPVDGKPQDG